MTPIDRAALAAELHAYADTIGAGTAPVPAMRHAEADGVRLRIIPRALHDVLCAVRIATPQDTVPVVLGCAGCGFCYPRIQPQPASDAVQQLGAVRCTAAAGGRRCHRREGHAGRHRADEFPPVAWANGEPLERVGADRD